MTDVSKEAVDALLQGVATRMRQHTGPTEIHELVSRTDVRDALRAALDEAEARATHWHEGWQRALGGFDAKCKEANEQRARAVKAEVERDAANALLRQIADLTTQHGGAAQALKLIRKHLGAKP